MCCGCTYVTHAGNMAYVDKYLIGVFILCINQDVTNVLCATVTMPKQTGLYGANPLNLTCTFTLETGERAQTLTIKKRKLSGPDTDLALFYIVSGESLHSGDSPVRDRTTLMLLGDSAKLRFITIECGDAATYQCQLTFSKNITAGNIADDMTLAIEAKPIPSITISPAYNDTRTFVENEELEIRCQGDVGFPAGNFLWFVYPSGNGAGVDVTDKSIQGTPIPIVVGPRYCAFRRESTLKLNLSRNDNDVKIRCVLNHTTLGQPPTLNDPCADDICTQTQPIKVHYPVQQRDIAISSNPPGHNHDVGSAVTMTCTVDGNPAPYFRWEKDGDDTISLEGENTWTLSNLQLGHEGTYRCFANNIVNGVSYNASQPININVVETTTFFKTTSTSPTTTTFTGGKTAEGVQAGGGPDNMVIIIIVCVVIGVLLIVALIVAFVIVRKRRIVIFDDPGENNETNISTYNNKPDLILRDEQIYYTDKHEDGLSYGDLKVDDRPRSRRPVELADCMPVYPYVIHPQV